MLKTYEIKQLKELTSSNPDIYEYITQKDDASKTNLKTGCHELRNILTLISGNYQLLSLAHPDLKEDAHWDTLGDDINFLVSAMNSISQYRYADTIHLKSVEFCNFINTSVQKLKASYPQMRIRLCSSISYTNLMIDESQIWYVLDSLIKNIYDINSDTTACINVYEESQCIFIEVLDALPNFNTEIQKNLFQPFNSDKENHIGLSLATASIILKSHKGELTRKDNHPYGSIFTLMLPIET